MVGGCEGGEGGQHGGVRLATSGACRPRFTDKVAGYVVIVYKDNAVWQVRSNDGQSPVLPVVV